MSSLYALRQPLASCLLECLMQEVAAQVCLVRLTEGLGRGHDRDALEQGDVARVKVFVMEPVERRRRVVLARGSPASAGSGRCRLWPLREGGPDRLQEGEDLAHGRPQAGAQLVGVHLVGAEEVAGGCARRVEGSSRSTGPGRLSVAR